MSRAPTSLAALLLTLAATNGFAAPERETAPNPRAVETKSPASALMDARALSARIDAFIESSLILRGIEPAPLASDAEFMRRVYLDLAGRIPSEADVRAFLADASTDRRARLVDTLLASPYHVRHMANTWQGVMSPVSATSNPQAVSTHPFFRAWLEKQVQDNTPYDRMVRELLTSPMNSPFVGKAYYYRNNVNRKIGIKVKIQQELINEFKEDLIKNPNPKLDLKLRRLNPGAIPANPEQIKIKIKIDPNFKEGLDLAIRSKGDIDINDIAEEFVGGKGAVENTAVNQILPGAFFFEANEYKPENLAASTARRFLGVRLECAQCHNHPFASWSRKQFWEFATFFSGAQFAGGAQVLLIESKIRGKIDDNLERVQTAIPGAGRKMTIPGTDKVVEARFLDGKTPEFKDNVESRHTLANWLTAPSNPYFARTATNRLWAHFFGIGIIDTIEDEPTEENPASHPELLTELTNQFVAQKFDIKYLIRAIVLSKSYQRSSAATSVDQNEPRLFARMAVKGLTPEQLFDNLALATGYQDPKGHQPGMIIPNTPRGDFLIMFSSKDRTTETRTSILQALTLMNGKLITDATSLSAGQKLTALLNGPGTIAEKIEVLYLSTLSRLPRADEASRMSFYVENQADARAALADIFWALLNSSEFLFNH